MILAIWIRIWIGWWALLPVAAVMVWLWLNPHIFPAVTTPRNWASKGIYGEKLRLLDRSQVPQGYQTILRWLIGLGLVGFGLIGWGVWKRRV